MKLSEQIKKYRKENNLTQEQFASKLFVSKQAVSKWETNRSYPDINLLPQIAEMLNISIDELIGKKETENSTNNQEKIIEKKIPKKKIFICSACYSIIYRHILCFFNIKNENLKLSFFGDDGNPFAVFVDVRADFFESRLFQKVFKLLVLF